MADCELRIECWKCGEAIREEEATDVYSEIRGTLKVHRRCAGAAQDELDDEFNEEDDNVNEEDDAFAEAMYRASARSSTLQTKRNGGR